MPLKVLLWTNIGGSGVYIMYWTSVSSLSQHISQEESSPHPPKEYGNTINGRERGGCPLKNVYELLPGINIKPRKYPKNLSKHFILVHCKLIGANILITIFFENMWCASELCIDFEFSVLIFVLFAFLGLSSKVQNP